MTKHKTYKKEKLKNKQITKHYGYTYMKHEKINPHEFSIIVLSEYQNEFEDFLTKDSFFIQVEVPQLKIYKLFVKKEI
ncbi:MAG: hypothetical protein GDA46_03030 [Bdellovibrionales bacterium]|nr:hypothetical protein [Bdellovibrionales bacterium]